MTDNEAFEEGMRFYMAQDYKKALQYFLYVKDNFLRSPHAGKTRFYAGESYFELEEYTDASIEYQSFLSFFPHDPHAPEAQYKLGVCYLKQALSPDRDQTMLHKALGALEQVRLNYPDNQEFVQKATETIKKARNKLALHEYLVGVFYHKEQHYTSSNSRILYLLREYPESPLCGDGLFLMGENYLELEQSEDAINAFTRLIQEYPATQHVSDAQEKLAQLGVDDIPQPVIQAAPDSTESPMQEVPPAPIEGYVVLIRENQIFTDLIRTDGIREGMVLEIHRNHKLIGTLRITEIQEGFSVGEVVSLLPGAAVQEEDIICCPQAE